jgi:translation initiation factor IF-3
LKLITNASSQEVKEEKKGQHRQRINEEIKSPKLRVLDSEGKFVAIMTRNEALKAAEAENLDLVEIAPQAEPPVVKIIDFGKFTYEQQKREKQQRKQQASQQMKEIRFKWRTATHDFNFKTRHAREFINEGNKVKASVMFRGREITHQEIGKELLERFVEALQDVAKVDSTIKMEGKALSVVMAPDKTKKPKKDTPKDAPKETQE